MRYGSTVMILRQRNSLRNGGTVVPLVQRSSECKGRCRSKWQLFLGIRREFCWWTTSNRVQPSIKILMFFINKVEVKHQGKMSRKALQNCHPVSWQRLITHCRWNNDKTDLRLSGDAPSTLFSSPGSFWLLSVPQTQKTPKGWEWSGGN